MRPGSVVRVADIPADRQPAGASVRTLVDTGSDGPDGPVPGLTRRAVEVPPGARGSGTAADGGELLFVIGGTGRLEIDEQPGLPLQPDRGLLLPPGARYQLIPDDAAGLRLDTVALPGREGKDAGPEAATRDLPDCDVERTGDRTFRVLFGPGRGCAVATQFVGEIPPGRAADHSHPYDEVVLILAGRGVMHAGGTDHQLAPGSCIHLPPGLVHCLENTGTETLRVLGVFHPADSPAAKLPAG
jgi:quercetin dioxygenase-like cupin family protein